MAAELILAEEKQGAVPPQSAIQGGT